ncbi:MULTISPECIES: orotidine-5'-phosphate decarboxylase [unclassified Helicobacter]|uniref:orotidine-5'-phosphate decarboxylase n=1 Tax=unclassified Helicobacter TaxID=2593540 RepID=UPI000CF07E44|nr:MULTISPECIES: orotidine-5'-phosphate decarboxylase [unclassified Helicobacter]
MKLCVALDLEQKEENIKLLKQLKDFSQLWVKVGLRSFIRDGKDFLDSIRQINPDFKIFLDLKLYDIPNTMQDAINECLKFNIDMLTIHTSSGRVAMQELMQSLKMHKNPPLIMGVTALTSFDSKIFEEIYHSDINNQTIHLSKMAYESNLDGVVCSVYESLMIKNSTNKEFLTLTPGIRPFNEDNNDQKRVATIQQAFLNQSDFIVVGRPIYKNNNPLEIVKKIYEEISRCKS